MDVRIEPMTAADVPQVAELAADLAALLRAGISGSEYITLEEELELIGRYLAIQEVRFGDRFVCELDVDERFQHCVVPKLILQPLVENAIIHGVADSDEGFIKLWAEEDAEGYPTRHVMRCEHSKLTTVKALQSIGYTTIASGDSYNDLDMLLYSKAGFLFRGPEKIKQDYPQIKCCEEYGELLSLIRAEL